LIPIEMGCATSKSSAYGDGRRFDAFYDLQEGQIGSGQFSVVRLARRKEDGQVVAIKCIKKADMTQEDIDALDIEKTVMRKLTHPNLIRLLDDFEDAHYHYLVMDYASGGELFHKIVEREVYTEQQARECIREMTKAVDFCHQRGVVHRDLKPENVLLAAANDETIKIADFGFAKELGTTPDGLLHTACGTPGYVAPEILRQRPYGAEVDIWSLGVIVYILLCGYPPFHSEQGQHDLFRKIKAAEYEFESPDWDDISDDAKDLIRHILVPDPRRRFTAAQILAHPWMQKDTVGKANLARTVDNMRKFNARRKLRAAQKAVLTTVRMRRLIAGLTKAAETSEAEDEQQTAAAAASSTSVQSPAHE
jgi:calcium/calmodulin-dependent protein kinase I